MEKRMSDLGKFLQLSATERRLMVKAAFLLGAIRLGLWLLPYKTLRRVLALLARAPVDLYGTERSSVDRLAWAVTKASSRVPRATCLTQALAAQVLLTWHGHPANLRVGIARGEDGKLQGHAWLDSRGRVVVGGGELSRYTRLPDMERENT
jgi:hypothetical protein